MTIATPDPDLITDAWGVRESWRHDPCFVPPDALDRWKSQEILQLGPAPPKRRTVFRQGSQGEYRDAETMLPHAEISGPHAASAAAWRNSEVPLSQWEISERGESLVRANKLAEDIALQRARAQLRKLLTVTEYASRGKARWQERPGLIAGTTGTS